MKKLMSLLTAAAMLFTASAVNAVTGDRINVDGIIYAECSERNSEKPHYYSVIGITDELKEETVLVIPEEVNGLKVTSINAQNLDIEYSTPVKYTDIGLSSENLEEIRALGEITYCNIFWGKLPNLKKINLADENVTIGRWGFQNKKNLEYFTADGKNRITESWKLEDDLFRWTSIKSIILDRSLVSEPIWILGGRFDEDSVFNQCYKLRTVYMTEKCTEIKGATFPQFYYCTALDYLYFPDSIESLSNVFGGSTALRTAVFPAKDVEINAYSYGSGFDKAARVCFGECPNLTIFGKSGTTVEAYANEQDIPFIGSVINHGEPSTVVAKADQTATVTINGVDIPAYTVNGSVYVGESALKCLGFNMAWDGEARTTTVIAPENVEWSVELNTNDMPYSIDVVSSDVEFWYNDFRIPALNVGNGESIIDVNALAEAVLY